MKFYYQSVFLLSIFCAQAISLNAQSVEHITDTLDVFRFRILSDNKVMLNGRDSIYVFSNSGENLFKTHGRMYDAESTFFYSSRGNLHQLDLDKLSISKAIVNKRNYPVRIINQANRFRYKRNDSIFIKSLDQEEKFIFQDREDETRFYFFKDALPICAIGDYGQAHTFVNCQTGKEFKLNGHGFIESDFQHLLIFKRNIGDFDYLLSIYDFDGNLILSTDEGYEESRSTKDLLVYYNEHVTWLYRGATKERIPMRIKKASPQLGKYILLEDERGKNFLLGNFEHPLLSKKFSKITFRHNKYITFF